MTDNTLIYEVTLDVKRRAAKRFDAWLKLHMRDMLTLPGFLDARLLPPDQVPAGAEPGTVRRVVQYRLASRADLENYLGQHAARMRAESARYFGRQLRASRRLLDADGRELVLSQDAAAALAQPVLRCLNCNASLNGKFCSECGQPSHTYAAPLRADIEDFFGNHVGFDTKFFRSIGPLLFRPGFLSREYSAGRRVRYINPLRLYFFSSLLFFFIAWTYANPQFMRFDDTGQNVKSSHTLTQSERQKIQNNPYLSDKQKGLIIGSAQSVPQGIAVSGAGNDNNVNFSMFGKQINMTKTEFTAKITHAFETSLPKLMFVFLPLVALLLKLFYIRSRRYYMEHLVFTLHNHAFVFVAMIFMVLANILTKHAGWLTAPAHYFNVIVGWYMAIYIFLAMRFYYRQSFFKTLFKYLLLGFIYWVTMLITFVAGMIVIFTGMIAS
ncbi:MAG: DUF4286 family protein [Gammaproteobacteria bacterium]